MRALGTRNEAGGAHRPWALGCARRSMAVVVRGAGRACPVSGGVVRGEWRCGLGPLGCACRLVVGWYRARGWDRWVPNRMAELVAVPGYMAGRAVPGWEGVQAGRDGWAGRAGWWRAWWGSDVSGGGAVGARAVRGGRRAWCACRYGPGWTVVREPGGRPVVVDLSGDARWGGRRRPGSRGEPGRWSVTPSPSGGRSGSAAERGRRRRSVSGWRLVSRCRTPWRRGRAARRPPGPPSGRSPRRGRRSPRRRPP